MLYFREEEKKKLEQFAQSGTNKAMAVYGRRRTGKTALMMDFFHSFGESNRCVYYQCTSFDYAVCLEDFKEILCQTVPDAFILQDLNSFRKVFQYLTQTGVTDKIIIIDEFPSWPSEMKTSPLSFNGLLITDLEPIN